MTIRITCFSLVLPYRIWALIVATATTQKEAEDIIEKFRPDLAILDLMMENQDTGFHTVPYYQK
jgi:CheY-like chemotaxis protein